MNLRFIQEEKRPGTNIISLIGNGISSSKNRTVFVESPGDLDVLCGKDKNMKNHPGNKAFSSMIDTMVTRYQGASSKQEKMNITREIVLEMKRQYNTRFLKKSMVDGKEVWSEIPDEKARDKVSHAIRFAAANPKRSDRSPSPDDTSSKESASEMKSHDTAMGALIQRQQAIMSHTEISALGTHDQQHFSHACISRYEDHLDSVRSEDLREYLIEPFGVRYDSKDTVFNSLRTEDLDAMMTDPVPADEWRDPMIE
ncbi:hypothetical protein FisN_6Hh215 [Fistulifera solaris]|uniref:DUF6824 domain-containing protein n=1 Tax=Fistulifera solaris TaxID=1519565 RepID=A0A1Z5K1V4_FISSO|nr:hypothetical protein FisN_6Hh215 [Fistulifera solaris]|eukprot:GAX20264.1 hypothetical protein FisN_6Hh215 [Fistulifera solaris]